MLPPYHAPDQGPQGQVIQVGTRRLCSCAGVGAACEWIPSGSNDAGAYPPVRREPDTRMLIARPVVKVRQKNSILAFWIMLRTAVAGEAVTQIKDQREGMLPAGTRVDMQLMARQ